MGNNGNFLNVKAKPSLFEKLLKFFGTLPALSSGNLSQVVLVISHISHFKIEKTDVISFELIMTMKQFNLLADKSILATFFQN